jgi:hypothetical protein
MGANLKNAIQSEVVKYKKENSSLHSSPSYVPANEFQIISILESYGFTVKGKYIYKKTNRKLEVCGNFNESSIYFHASNNIYPFEPSKLYSFSSLAKGFNTSIVDLAELERISAKRKAEKQNEKPKKIISFQEYLSTTNENHNFNLQKVIDKFHLVYKNSLVTIPLVWENDNNVRSKYGNTYFPILNEKNELITSQIIPYNSDLKRDRSKNIYYTASAGVIGLYRRNLYNQKLKTIIVESPKLAELGALILPRFNWFATNGKERLKTIDLSFLDAENTFILPDTDAFIEWKDIALINNFNVIDIFQLAAAELPNEIQHKYSDFADFITDYLNGNTETEGVFYFIYDALLNLNIYDDVASVELDNYSSEFGFSEKKKTNSIFISSIPKHFSAETKGIYKKCSASGFNIQTKYFKIYDQSFESISASFNINEDQKEDQFINNLSKCFRVIRYLNKDAYLSKFEYILNHIQANGNYHFNRRYIYDILINSWNEIDDLHIDDLIKIRNYKYIGSQNIDIQIFLDELRKAKKIFKINTQLNQLKKLIEVGKNKDFHFIDKKSLGVTRLAGNEYISSLVDRYNIATIGSTNSSILKFVQKNVLFINSIYREHTKRDKTIKLNIFKLSNELNVSRKVLKKVLEVERNDTEITILLNEINYYLDYNQEFEVKKTIIKNRVYNSVFPIPMYSQKKELSWSDAFVINNITRVEVININNEWKVKELPPIEFENSSLNCDLEQAIKGDYKFITSWYLFQNPSISNEDRELLKNDIQRTANYVKDLFYSDLSIKWNIKQFFALRQTA